MLKSGVAQDYGLIGACAVDVARALTTTRLSHLATSFHISTFTFAFVSAVNLASKSFGNTCICRKVCRANASSKILNKLFWSRNFDDSDFDLVAKCFTICMIIPSEFKENSNLMFILK